MIFYDTIFLIFGLCAVSLALPTSLLEDMKDAQFHTPVRTNKVKRAQEFIMFGNQQNRAINNFGSTKNEKRAAELDDNSLVDEEEPMPTLVSDLEEHVYNNNQLGQGREPQSHISRDLYYNMLLRNLDLSQNLHNEPAYNLDLPYYNIMESREKREIKEKSSKDQEWKREDSLTPEELLVLLKVWENMEKPNRKLANPRYSLHENDPYDEEDEMPVLSDDNGPWYDRVDYYSHPSREREVAWPRQHKRFMVSKRFGRDSIPPVMPFQEEYADEIPLRRRFLL
ncbi:uncharacterized protein LOC106667027 [Cimex lectularius]|uniref:Uncharacterized protein n=1 Tax=Cimex lectularius TaxID=79782 RepID=A0A8I6RP60_CIMLE|nr:uncharacterized protein LOC106667027 [Cimex lectularius]